MVVHSGSGGKFGNVPPVGTSAYKAFKRATSIDPRATANPYSFSPKSSTGTPIYHTAVDKVLTKIQSGEPVLQPIAKSGSGSVSPVNSGSASSVSTGILAPSTIDYLNADMAKHYGMSRETAYAEAMENTAYARAVADMKSAGLNPAVIFGAGRGYAAGTPDYISSVSSSSDSSSSGGSSAYSYKQSYSGGKSSNNGKLFNSGVYSVLSALGGVVGAAATKNAGGFWIGTSIAQAAMSAANLLNQAIK